MGEDLNRWLRAVRPGTEADSDWAESSEAEELLASVHHRVSGDGRRTQRSWLRPPRRVWLPAGSTVVVAVIALIALVLTTGGNGGPPGPSAPLARAPELPSARPVAMLLQQASSCADLLAGLRRHAAASVAPYGFPSTLPPILAAGKAVEDLHGAVPASGYAASRQAAGSSATDANSATNVQEPGVDEPDIVKTDGDRIVTITDGTLRVINAGTRQVTGSLDLTSYVGGQDAQLLVSGNSALVLLGSAGSYLPLRRGGIGPYLHGTASSSTYLSVDLSGAPRVVGSLNVDGNAIDARQVGQTVRLVVSNAPAIAFPNSNGSVAENRKVIQQAPLSAWLPRYTLTSGDHTKTGTVPCDRVSYPAAYTGASMLTIYTLNFGNLDAAPQPVTIAADGDTVYATSSSLYVASDPYTICCSTSPDRTEIHRFDIAGKAKPTYLGSGSIPGHLLSQYALSAYDGSLRAATTQSVGSSASNSVYVLDADTLTVSGHVDGLGKGEQIYAVRFLGPLAYVVTFHQTDPLYVVDLRDPKQPAVVGSLQLTGYSNYLHDAGNGRLIGVGQEATSQGMATGFQVSLFDVTSPAHPVRTGKIVRNDAPGGDMSFDPHAFLYWQPTGLVAVPIQSWQASESGKVLVARVSGAKLAVVGVVANPSSTTIADDGLGIQRSLLVHGNLWTVSGSGVRVSDASSLAQRSWIAFS